MKGCGSLLVFVFVVAAAGRPVTGDELDTNNETEGLPTEHTDVMLSARIPVKMPLRPLLGSKVVVPCHIQNNTGPQNVSQLSHSIRWTYVTENNVKLILVATNGKIDVECEYQDRVTMVSYPLVSTDATMEITEVRSKDSGTYHCEVMYDNKEIYDSVDIQVQGIVFHYYTGHYSLSFEEAKAACIENSASIATPAHLRAAYHDGMDQCNAGWLSDQTVRYPLREPREDCWGDGSPGVISYGEKLSSETFDVYCFAEKMPGRVFFSTSGEEVEFTFNQAGDQCTRLGSRLATTGELYLAWQDGMDVCQTGWLADQSVRYPINIATENCGGGTVGVITMDIDPNIMSRHNAWCFQELVSIPMKMTLRPLLGSNLSVPCYFNLKTGDDDPETPTMAALSHHIRWTHVTENKIALILEALDGRVHVEKEYKDRVNMVNYPTAPTDATIEITEVRSKDSGTYRCEVMYDNEEIYDSVDIQVQGIVFHYYTGHYSLSFEKAKAACIENSASIATPTQLRAAYHDGMDQCNAGWLSDQTVRYPLREPREDCWGDGSPGVILYGERLSTETFDVYCFAEKMPGRVFFSTSGEEVEFTFNQAGDQCTRLSSRLATTGELYLAWQDGMDVCQTGWLADQSVRYPINFATENCGGGTVGVITMDIDPNIMSRHNAWCFQELVSISMEMTLRPLLGSNLSVPCYFNLKTGDDDPETPTMAALSHHIRWTHVTENKIALILEALDGRVHVEKEYKDRVNMVNYPTAPTDATIEITEVRSKDSGTYRCEVMYDNEEIYDSVDIQVQGIVFHYYTGHYSLSFEKAKAACIENSASIATPTQLRAAYHDGMDQCNAGWLSDQTVRYPLREPREDCWGDGSPGVISYGERLSIETFDVYCFAEKMPGRVFFSTLGEEVEFTFNQAGDQCTRLGSRLATTGELYLAWQDGMDVCQTGWLADQSVRYPINFATENCGGGTVGVITMDIDPNIMSRHNAWCFQELVSIPMEMTLRPLLGSNLSVPCYFNLKTGDDDPETLTMAVLSHHIRWTHVTDNKITLILEALDGRVHVEKEYKDRVNMVNYPTAPTDATIEITEVRSKDSGTYRCEVMYDNEEIYDSVDIQVQGIVFHYYTGHYSLSFEKAKAVCIENSASIATPAQLRAAYHDGMDQCNAGWLSDQTVRYPLREPREDCWGDGSHGVISYGEKLFNETFDVYCFAEKMPGRVFFSTSGEEEEFTFNQAGDQCTRLGSRLATTGELYMAWQDGMDLCQTGWLADQSVRYPINFATENCGGGTVGVITMDIDPNIMSRHNAWCFQELVSIPMDFTLRPLLGSSLLVPCYFKLKMGDDPEAPTMDPLSHRIRWTYISKNNTTLILEALDSKFHVEKEYKDRVNMVNYPTAPTDATIEITEVRSNDSGTYRCEVMYDNEEIYDSVDIQVQGIVFHYYTGHYSLSFEKAKAACIENSASIATPAQLRAAYHDGMDQCNAGWLSDQTVRYPLREPREDCWGDGSPGVISHGEKDSNETFDVYCFAEKMSGRVFFSTWGEEEEFTFNQAGGQCTRLGSRLATTGELYLAWQDGMDVCQTGWLADQSVLYPINIATSHCGNGTVGVITKDVHPNITSQHNVLCFQELVSIPMDFTLRPLLGSSLLVLCYFKLKMGDDPEAPTMDPLSHRIRWTYISKNNTTLILEALDSKFHVEKEYKDRVNMVNYPTAPTDATIEITEVRSNDSGTYRCEVMYDNEEIYDSVDIQVQGIVFHYYTDHYSLSFEKAKAACIENSASIATPAQLRAAYHDGMDQCNAGWLSDQTVRYPLREPREDCWGDGSPGVISYGEKLSTETFDVYCFAEKMPGRVFFSTSGEEEEFTFNQAGDQCTRLGRRLATTGELYLAWQDGMDVCQTGWLADQSVRYPINIATENCGGGTVGVITMDIDPNIMSRHNAWCFQELVSIPMEMTLRPLLGSNLSLPCYFNLKTGDDDPETPTMAALSHHIRWTHVTENKITLILEALDGRVHVEKEYKDRVTMVNYPTAPNDATIEITEVRSKDSGTYRCEVMYDNEEIYDSVDIQVQGIVFHYYTGHYSLSFEKAKAVCIENSASIATPVQLRAAYHDGMDQCNAGWLSDQTVRYPLREPREDCWGDGSPGVISYGEKLFNETFDVYCFAEKMPGRVFFSTSGEEEEFTFNQAGDQCTRLGSRLATTGELYLAWQDGMDVCQTGWLADQSVRYPINIATENCGGGTVGVITMDIDPNIMSRHNAWCFQELVSIPMDFTLRPLLGSSLSVPCYFKLKMGDDPEAPTMDPLSHRIRWTYISKNNTTLILEALDSKFHVEKEYKDRVNMVNYPTAPTDATIEITEVRSNDSGTYRCEVMYDNEEIYDSVDIQVQGIVFHYYTGHYSLSFEKAKAACIENSASIATPAQLRAAYHDGMDQCNAGWLSDQTVRYPLREPREDCWGDGSPGVISHGEKDSNETFDVYCFAEKMSGRVFFSTWGEEEEFTFNQAGGQCTRLGSRLATTGELYLAWQDGMDVCQTGWLADQSVLYPINIATSHCGNGTVGVITKDVHPNITSQHNVLCFQELVSIPMDFTLRPLLGSSLSVPCYFKLKMGDDPEAPTMDPLSHRIRWTYISKNNTTLILEALDSKFHVEKEYKDRVNMVNYPTAPTDATIEITEVRSNDSGTYRCEVMYDNEEIYDSVDIQVQGIVFHYYTGHYSLSFEKAKAACIENSASIATPAQLRAAYHDGMDQCNAGWLSDQTVRYPLREPREDCWGDGSPGVISYGERLSNENFDVYCFAEKMPGRVFFSTSGEEEEFTFNQAGDQCTRLGRRLATTGELYLAWQDGMDVCQTGWLADQSVRYPINIATENCGGGTVGVITMDIDPNIMSRHNAWCFQELVSIPMEMTLRPLLGSNLSVPCYFNLKTGDDDPETPTMAALSHRIRWTHVTENKITLILEALDGRVHVEKEYKDRVTMVNYPTAPTDATVEITEVRSKDSGTYRCEVMYDNEEIYDSVDIQVQGIVFHYYTGHYSLSFEKAKVACIENIASIATPAQLRAAYHDGMDQCSAGWLSDQTVRYPLREPRDGCWGDEGGSPGVKSYGKRNANDKFDVYCFAEKISGRIFFSTSEVNPHGFTFYEAEDHCINMGGYLATTGELYLAWQGGMDVCQSGWLADRSITYPINIAKDQCGEDTVGVITMDVAPDIGSQHNAWCFQELVNIPVETTLRPLLGSSLSVPCFLKLKTDADPEAPTMVRWTFITENKIMLILEALDGTINVEKEYKDRVNMVNYPTAPTDATIEITEVRSKDSGTYRCEVMYDNEEIYDSVDIQVQGIVFHYYTGHYSLSFEKAKAACIENSASIATPAQLRAAYHDGMDQCNAGWLSDQTVRYPLREPREDCWGDGSPGVISYGEKDSNETFDVYCFAEKMSGRVFFSTCASEFTFSEAGDQCTKLGGSLATTGELYLAWQNGMHECQAGWLADQSVRYPINIATENCGAGTVGVITMDVDPNITSRHSAWCFQEGEVGWMGYREHLWTEDEDFLDLDYEALDRDMFHIDDAAHNLMMNVDALQTSLSTVEDLLKRLKVLEARLSTSENRSNDFNFRLSAQENNVEYLNNRLSVNVIKDESHTKRLDAVESNVEDLMIKNKDHLATLSGIEMRMTQIERQIEELKKPDTVAFSAADGGEGCIGPCQTNTTFIYRRTITNVGNAYDNTTGMFTAPVAGMYYFTVFYETGMALNPTLYLCKNDQRMTIISDNGGNAVTLQLQQDEVVYVHMQAASGDVLGDIYGHTTFTGFVLR